jgi:AcrR family transcriptional regulator
MEEPMAADPRPTQDAGPRLSRDRVLAMAIGLADADGIEALTIRRLAAELGVGTMSVYYYVADKDEILDGIVDMVVDEMDLPGSGADWKAELRTAALSAHEALIRHPWAAGLLLSGPRVSAARMRQMDAILGCLRGAGFTPEMTDHAYHALDSHITGFTLWLVGISAGMERLGPIDAFLRRVDRDALPHLAEHIDQHMKERSPDEIGEFEFGLNLILDGLERMLAAAG